VPPEDILLVIIMSALTLYAVLGGADFGIGVWEFNSALQTTPSERKLMAKAIAPVWEVNHVWLIFVLVLMNTAFPTASAAISRALWVPLLLALMGIVFRGASFVFRNYTDDSVRGQELWTAVFAMASTAAPFFLGVSIGALASGMKIQADGSFDGDYLNDWLTPLSLFTGFFAVGMCAYLSAVYLIREAHVAGDQEQAELWRRRALATGVWMGVLAATGLVLLSAQAPELWDRLSERGWPILACSLLLGFASLLAVAWRRYTWGAVGAAATVATVLWGWGVAQYPLLVPPHITVETAKSSPAVLLASLYATAAGAVLLLPSLAWLFYIFKWAKSTTAQPPLEKRGEAAPAGRSK